MKETWEEQDLGKWRCDLAGAIQKVSTPHNWENKYPRYT